MDELPPGYFYCSKCRCTLSVSACIGRQAANERRKAFESIRFGICLQCPQGLENRLRFEKSMKEMRGKSKPERGQGHRHMDCERYDACLSMAAKEGWKTWRCSDACPFMPHNQGKGKVTKPAQPKAKKENTRICDDCKEKITLSLNCPLCASCMAKRSNAKAKAAKKEPEPKPEAGTARKRATESPAFGRSRPCEGPSMPFPAKGPAGSNGTLLVEFGRHGHKGILDQVVALSEQELRPLDLQVVFMLREYLKSASTGD